MPPLLAPLVEVAEELAAPLRQGAAEAGDFGGRTVGERGQDGLGDGSAGGMGGLVVGGADLQGAPPDELDLEVSFVGGERLGEPVLLPVGEVLGAGAQNVADPTERVVLAAAVAVDVLLHRRRTSSTTCRDVRGVPK